MSNGICVARFSISVASVIADLINNSFRGKLSVIYGYFFSASRFSEIRHLEITLNALRAQLCNASSFSFSELSSSIRP